jgi:FkbM family methyltransferase
MEFNIMHAIKVIISETLARLGYEIRKKEAPAPSKLNGLQSGDFPLALWRRLRKEDKRLLATYIPDLNSQFGQDFFVLCCLLVAPDIPHFFIEAGAADGIQWSNTKILEAICGWRGILVEPCKAYETLLHNNRTSTVDTRCLASVSGNKVLFREVSPACLEFPYSSPELSCVDQLMPDDWASNARSNNSITYEVETVSFDHLMSTHASPYHIGYLSLDTEGSEMQILSSIDFSRYVIDIVTVEHNFRVHDMRQIKAFMEEKGFMVVLEDLSHCDFWFVRRPLIDKLYFA